MAEEYYSKVSESFIHPLKTENEREHFILVNAFLMMRKKCFCCQYF